MLGLGLGIPLSSLVNTYKLTLDAFSGAAAAYSLSLLSEGYTGDCLSFRRTSDNQSLGVGFVDGEIDSQSIENFINQQVTTYTSDFSVDADAWTGTGGVITGNIDSIGGQDDVLRYIVDSNFSSHFTYGTKLELNQLHEVKLKVYLPSSNTQINRIRVFLGASGTVIEDVTVTDQWVEITVEDTPTGNNRINIFGISSGQTNYQGNGTDTFYVKDVSVLQKTSDGRIEAWFDQSGTGGYLLQTNTAFQPYIAKSGSYLGYIEPVTENSVALVSTFQYTAENPFTSFIVAENRGKAVLGGTIDANRYYAVAENTTASAQSGFANPTSYFSNGTPIGSTRADIFNAVSQYSVLTSLSEANPTGNVALTVGYSNQQYNYFRIKEIIIYDNQTVNREKVEKNIIKRYGF